MSRLADELEVITAIYGPILRPIVNTSNSHINSFKLILKLPDNDTNTDGCDDNFKKEWIPHKTRLEVLQSLMNEEGETIMPSETGSDSKEQTSWEIEEQELHHGFLYLKLTLPQGYPETKKPHIVVDKIRIKKLSESLIIGPARKRGGIELQEFELYKVLNMKLKKFIQEKIQDDMEAISDLIEFIQDESSEGLLGCEESLKVLRPEGLGKGRENTGLSNLLSESKNNYIDPVATTGTADIVTVTDQLINQETLSKATTACPTVNVPNTTVTTESTKKPSFDCFWYPQFRQGLLDAGFQKVTNSEIYTNNSKNGRAVTIERDDPQSSYAGVYLSCDGLDLEDIENWVMLYLGGTSVIEAQEPDLTVLEEFGKSLLQWARANSDEAAEPGFEDGNNSDDDDDDDSDLHDVDSLSIQTKYLPSIKELPYLSDRKLTIYTWGRAMMKSHPPQAQVNFNATVLSGKAKTVNLKKCNGLTMEVQARVSRCSLFPQWMSMVVGKIEKEDLMSIAINCRKGRHRSVAAAEILKKVYYKGAVIHHLTIC